MRRHSAVAAALAVALAAVPAAAAAPGAATAAAVFFDDFAHADLDALRRFGWTLRSAAGHPGVPGATWSPGALQMRREESSSLSGLRERAGVRAATRASTTLLRLTARTDGTPQGTVQSQLCHARKVLRGTYAARVRFANEPESGADGDPVIQTFYAVSPLRHDFDPDFSEIDWEYLANGGWGSPETRLYAITWQTVRIEPWQAHNAAHEEKRELRGWHTLVVQAGEHDTRWFVDGREVARHGGRNRPVVPMAISFSLWFSPTGLLPPGHQPREWVQDVDWVLHAKDRLWSPREVEAHVHSLRRRGIAQMDTVPEAAPPLPSPCNF